jgi:uncharacterized membrane protein YvbJ
LLDGAGMVYCVNCGANNPEGAETGTQCGKSIMQVERRPTTWKSDEGNFARPFHWGGILIGLFVIMIGAAFLFRQFVPTLVDIFWPLVLIFVGIAIILSGVSRYSRH